jgi:hypothetical protein
MRKRQRKKNAKKLAELFERSLKRAMLDTLKAFILHIKRISEKRSADRLNTVDIPCENTADNRTLSALKKGNNHV